jgi:hypothetical protein
MILVSESSQLIPLSIAAKVGKTPAYITTPLKLTDLCDEAAAAFYQTISASDIRF